MGAFNVYAINGKMTILHLIYASPEKNASFFADLQMGSEIRPLSDLAVPLLQGNRRGASSTIEPSREPFGPLIGSTLGAQIAEDPTPFALRVLRQA